MKNEDYPALYRASDVMALKAQKNYVAIIFLSLVSVILASSLTLISENSIFFAICAAVCFVLGLMFSLILATRRYDKTWYLSRAVAESVKTITWRYMMRAEPFD